MIRRARSDARSPSPDATGMRRTGRQARLHRYWVLTVAMAATMGLAGGSAQQWRPLLIWNATASAPIGIYLVMPPATVDRGDMIAVFVPAAMRRLASERRYIPATVPLVKRVLAVAGDVICASGRLVTIDGSRVLVRRLADGAGRPMPAWTGCRRLATGQLFVGFPKTSASFDGRYFGVSDASDVVGRVRPLWVR